MVWTFMLVIILDNQPIPPLETSTNPEIYDSSIVLSCAGRDAKS